MARPPPKKAPPPPPRPGCKFAVVGLDEIFDAEYSVIYDLSSKPVEFEDDPSSLHRLTKCAALALGDYNTQNHTDYRFVNIEMATSESVGGALYHITFKSRNAENENEYRSFQATVYHNRRMRNVERIRMKREQYLVYWASQRAGLGFGSLAVIAVVLCCCCSD